MVLLFKSTYDDSPAWRTNLQEHIPDIEVRTWTEAIDPSDIDYALVWKPEPGYLRQFPNLKVIFSLGAGVDHIFSDPDLPGGIPIVRIVDSDLASQIGDYVTYGVLHFHRRMPYYIDCAQRREWGDPGRADTSLVTVGVMGFGNIGQDIGRKLTSLGFKLRGWSRTPKSVPGIECFHGDEALAAFLDGINVLVCSLPLTSATDGIVNAAVLGRLAKGAYVINIGRGQHIIDEDLSAAIRSGQVAGAMLDVFRQEPLPKDHPFWSEPAIMITPHIAGDPNARTAAKQVADNILRSRAKKPLQNVVNPLAGY